MRLKDLTGQRFDKLTVIERVPNSGTSKWRCRCDCGNERIVFGTNLTTGRARSCGCSKITHGDSYSKLYRIHARILRDGVCDEWREYEVFKSWALENGYGENVQIVRVDSGEPFSPSNCVIKN